MVGGGRRRRGLALRADESRSLAPSVSRRGPPVEPAGGNRPAPPRRLAVDQRRRLRLQRGRDPRGVPHPRVRPRLPAPRGHRRRRRLHRRHRCNRRPAPGALGHHRPRRPGDGPQRGPSPRHRRPRRLPRRRRLPSARVAVLPRPRDGRARRRRRRRPQCPAARRPARRPSGGACSGRSAARAAERRPGRARARLQHGVLARGTARGRRVRPDLHGRRRRRRCVLARDRTRLGDRLPPRGPRVAPPPRGAPRLPASAAWLRPQRGARRGPPPLALHGHRHGAVAGAHLRLLPGVARPPARVPRALRRGRLPVGVPRRRTRARPAAPGGRTPRRSGCVDGAPRRARDGVRGPGGRGRPLSRRVGGGRRGARSDTRAAARKQAALPLRRRPAVPAPAGRASVGTAAPPGPGPPHDRSWCRPARPAPPCARRRPVVAR